jgi:hypothetical protein
VIDSSKCGFRGPANLPLDEIGALKAFDLNRDLILATAVRVYARGRKGSYDLVAADFGRRH